MAVVVVNDDGGSSRPLFPLLRVRFGGLGIGDRHPSPRRPITRPPTSFQTFHFAEGHEPP
ncbi:hypothetical protein LOAG_16877 [Loa loa]|uniref:Uncharacterized protein n=1 Tax=Loa loa TaxID=7209 RepID=A0A1S0UKU0_LOALO|nr:hypothetical protein LOAG_16877 [Loa loa]EJD76101.1 hypothetical protein LOAG_16877 [Loa loa]